MPDYRDFVPSIEADLVGYTNNFAAALAAQAAEVGRTPADVDEFAALNAAWVDAYRVAANPSTRTRSAVQLKRATKDVCVRKLRELAGLIQKYSGTTDALRADFGLRIAKHPSAIGVPDEIPRVVVRERYGSSVVIRLYDSTGRCAKPAGTHSARIYVRVSDEQPEGGAAGWHFYAQTTRMTATIDFDATLPPGTKVWITAMYCSPRGQAGTGCAPVSAHLAGGTMRITKNLSARAA